MRRCRSQKGLTKIPSISALARTANKAGGRFPNPLQESLCPVPRLMALLPVPICVTPEGFSRISGSALQEFDRRIEKAPLDTCLPFNQAASDLEVELNHSYRFVAEMGRELEDLDEIAALWDGFVLMCDRYAEKLRKLHEAHPMCGADYFYDRVLDLRNKCRRLADLHR